MTIQKHNDKFGWKRGLGAYSEESFGTGKHTYDSFKVEDGKEYGLIDNQPGQPAGKILGGGGPVSKGGPPKFKSKRGPIGNMERPK